MKIKIEIEKFNTVPPKEYFWLSVTDHNKNWCSLRLIGLKNLIKLSKYLNKYLDQYRK